MTQAWISRFAGAHVQATPAADSPERLMRSKFWLFFMVVLLVLSATALAQGPSWQSGTTLIPVTPAAGEGKEIGTYQVQQSIEFGYRFTELNGNTEMFNNLINQHTGPRLLEQTLSLHSKGPGALFDDLTVASFGWGGDPENVARLRMSKRQAYDFTVLFRRDQNYFDYNLFANPLNPTNAILTVPVQFSPHSFRVRRRLYDFGLTVLPQSRVSFRLGYSRNRSEGPSFSSFHEGTDVLLNQPWNFTSNNFRFGVDFKAMAHTTISYDQFVDLDKNDTDYSLAPFTTFLLPNGVPVEFGLPINPGPAAQPCATPLLAGGVANPACNGYFTYIRTQRVRTTTPTEQLTLQSNPGRVSLVGRVSYSSGDLDTPYFEFFDGLVTRTRERQFTFSGPASNRRVNVTSDLGLTVDLTKSVRLSDSFRFDNFRLPGQWNSVDTATVAAGTPATLLSPLGATTTTNAVNLTFLGQKSYYNLLQFEFTPSRHAGLRIGYRFRHRHVFHAEPEVFDPTVNEGPIEPFEGDTIEVNEHTGIFGVWFRPTDTFRINLETELMAADNFITRISPRQRQNYRARANYRPRPWATLSLSANIWEGRNGESDTRSRQHYRNAGFVLSLFPASGRAGIDLSYNYTDALQNAFICYNGTFIAPGTIVGGCPTFDPANNNSPNQIDSTYINNTHYASALLLLKPVTRVTVRLGYSLDSVGGKATLLNPLQPFGPLQYNYHQPLASLSLEVVKNVTLNGYWNYDQYNEKSFTGPTLPRYFHDNRSVVSVRYAF